MQLQSVEGQLTVGATVVAGILGAMWHNMVRLQKQLVAVQEAHANNLKLIQAEHSDNLLRLQADHMRQLQEQQRTYTTQLLSMRSDEDNRIYDALRRIEPALTKLEVTLSMLALERH